MYIDEDSAKQLDQVKKGKDRQFAMIAKGSKIKRLIVFKRGSAQAQILAAKKDGYKGEAYFGLATNSGGTILFQMARVDGFEQPPGKEVILKKAIEEETKMKLVINYHIVDRLPGAEEQADDEDSEVDTKQAPDDVCKKVKSELIKLKEPIGQAIEMDTQLKRPITSLIKEIQKAIKTTDADKAAKSFSELRKMVEV